MRWSVSINVNINTDVNDDQFCWAMLGLNTDESGSNAAVGVVEMNCGCKCWLC